MPWLALITGGLASASLRGEIHGLQQAGVQPPVTQPCLVALEQELVPQAFPGTSLHSPAALPCLGSGVKAEPSTSTGRRHSPGSHGCP